MTDIRPLIERAVAQFGSEAKLAKAAGVSQPAIHYARRNGECGPRLAIAIERATNGEISRRDLRPDLWPADLDGPSDIPRPSPVQEETT